MLVAECMPDVWLGNQPTKTLTDDNFNAYTSTDASGISTISESIVTVIPNVR